MQVTPKCAKKIIFVLEWCKNKTKQNKNKKKNGCLNIFYKFNRPKLWQKRSIFSRFHTLFYTIHPADWPHEYSYTSRQKYYSYIRTYKQINTNTYHLRWNQFKVIPQQNVWIQNLYLRANNNMLHQQWPNANSNSSPDHTSVVFLQLDHIQTFTPFPCSWTFNHFLNGVQ